MRYRLRTLLILLAIAPPLLGLIGVSVFHLRQKPPSAGGTVIYRGQPLADGTIEFVPDSDARHRFVTKTDDEGRYHLNGSQTTPPLTPGRYRVTITLPGSGRQPKSQLVTDLQPNSANEIYFELQ